MLTDIIIRESTLEDAEGIALVHVNSWKSSYEGILKQSVLDEINYQDRLKLRKEILESERGHSLVAVNQMTDDIVGFCDSGANRGEEPVKGEVYAIYLLEEYKGIGLGKKLFKESIDWLKDNGVDSALTWVLKNNTKACDFYRSLGGQLYSEQPIEIENEEYLEVSFVFELRTEPMLN